MGLIENNTKLRYKFGISDIELRSIEDFIQGAVYCWIKNRKNEIFGLRDLVGKENTEWVGTPLIVLHQKHINMNKSAKKAFEEAAKDAGWILKTVLHNDKRSFETHDIGKARGYRWVGNEE